MKILFFVNILLVVSLVSTENSSENKVEIVEKPSDDSTTTVKIHEESTVIENDTTPRISLSTLQINHLENEKIDENRASSMSPTSPKPTLPAKKRKIFYINQQQSGKFNVHLEFNDVSLIVIPKNKDPQLSLLNMLLKSAQKSNIKLSEEKKKEEITKVNGHNAGDYSKYRMDNYIHSSTIEPSIESRAPYHVDISSTLIQQPVLDIQPKNGNVQIMSNITRIPLLKILKPIPNAIQTPQAMRTKRSIDTSFLGIDSNVLGDVNIPDESEDDRNLINTIEHNNNIDELSQDDLNEYKPEFILLGAAENCGPGRRRNSYQICVPVTD